MTHASLFSGIGGCEVAAAMLGWENVFHCEINPFGRSVLEYWFPNSKSYEDITKTSFKEWRGKIDVLTGGFPCQPFSHAGQRRGADDDRYLFCIELQDRRERRLSRKVRRCLKIALQLYKENYRQAMENKDYAAALEAQEGYFSSSNLLREFDAL